MNATVTASSDARELAAICGAEQVTEDAESLAQFAIDETVPQVAVAPASASEVSAVVSLAAKKNLVVVPGGGFTQQSIGNIPAEIDILLDTRRLNRIEHYDPGDLTIGVGAGCTLAEINRTLSEHGQFLPVDPPHPERATVGGLLATAAHGPLRHSYGGLRDFCIGMSFVTGDGVIAKGGGRVVKNVAGYDLMKLLIGSHGTLAVISSANFKVFPKPDRQGELRTFEMEFASLSEALGFRDRLRQSPLAPMCLEIVSSRTLEYLAEPTAPRDPDEFAPAQPLPPESASWRLLLRTAGSETVLARYRRELGAAAGRELGGNGEAALWRAIAHFAPAVLERHRNAMVLSLSTTPTAVGSAVAAAQQAAMDNNFIPAFVGRAAISALTVAFIPLSVDPPSAMQYATSVSALRSALPEDATAVVTHCPTEGKRHFDTWGTTRNDFGCMRAVKRALDPKGILNRGRFLV